MMAISAITRTSSSSVNPAGASRRLTDLLARVRPIVDCVSTGVLPAVGGVKVITLPVVLAGELIDVRRAPGIHGGVLQVALPVRKVGRRHDQGLKAFFGAGIPAVIDLEGIQRGSDVRNIGLGPGFASLIA